MSDQRHFTHAPTAEELHAMAIRALDFLPQDLRRLCADIVFRVEEFADDEILDELEAESPYDVTGLYQGVSLDRKSVEQSGALPDMVFLYRAPLLLEWIETGEDLGRLVRHVVIHEIGHHFGFSDEAMHEIEENADREAMGRGHD